MDNKIASHILIAIDIAKKIKNRRLKETEKIKGRSIAASDYNVSSETVRKSFNLLAEYKVILVKEKSGATVISRLAAIDFLDIFQGNLDTRADVKELENLKASKKDIEKKIANITKRIQKRALSTQKDIPINIFEVTVHNGFSIIGKSLKELHVSENTNCTLFGIASGNQFISSIIDKYLIKENDVLYLAGEQEYVNNAVTYLKS